MNEPDFAMLLAEFRKMTQSSEGSVEHLYLDTKGNPTIGIGHLVSGLAAAKALTFYIKTTPEVAATPEQITREFDAIKKARYGKNYPASYYKDLTTLFLKSEKIESLYVNDVRIIVTDLEKHFKQFASYPLLAQLGILDMVYNLGVAGFIEKFPNMVDAIKDQNWQVASKQSHRIGVSEARNDAVKELFREAEKSKLAKAPPKKNSTNSSTEDESATFNDEEKSLRCALNYEHVTLFNAKTGTSKPQPGSWEAIKFQSTSSASARK